MELREKLIRLAHEKPELREHLLPLVTAGTQPQFDRRLNDRIKLSKRAAMSLPKPSKRPAGENFRGKVWSAVEADLRKQLAAAGVGENTMNKNIIWHAERMVRKDRRLPAKIESQVDLILWATGKLKVT